LIFFGLADFQQLKDSLQLQGIPLTNESKNRLDDLDPTRLARELMESCPLLRMKLSRALFCSADETIHALEEVIKFLILAAGSTDAVTPSARVDMAWHEFLLFTRTYASFCHDKLGKMVHHEPSIDHEANSQQYSQTLLQYRQRFGEPKPEFWGGPQTDSADGPSSAFCGSCESDSR
jgi:hypothetical protein